MIFSLYCSWYNELLQIVYLYRTICHLKTWCLLGGVFSLSSLLSSHSHFQNTRLVHSLQQVLENCLLNIQHILPSCLRNISRLNLFSLSLLLDGSVWYWLKTHERSWTSVPSALCMLFQQGHSNLASWCFDPTVHKQEELFLLVKEEL